MKSTQLKQFIVLLIFSLLLGAGVNEGLAASFEKRSRQAPTASLYTIASGLAVQPDGKIIVAGTAHGYFTLVRTNLDGSLDPGFGEAGRVYTPFTGSAGITAILLQPDGKILAVGENGGRFALARYHPDGSLDPGFGEGGKVTTGFGSSAGSADVALQLDGKIVAAGWAGSDFALARYHPDGSLDLSFGGGGKVTTRFAAEARGSGVVLQLDGKIVVAGRAGEDFAIARYNPDGSLDTAFDGDGIATTDFGDTPDAGYALALQPDQKIVVAGDTGFSYGLNFAVARYNPDGSLDPKFGSHGKVVTDVAGEWDYGYAVAIQPDDKILVAGASGVFCMCDFPSTNFSLARYTPNGNLDSSFGNGGLVMTEIHYNDWAYNMSLQPDGKIVLAGAAGGSYGEFKPREFGLARYHPDGSLDLSFDQDGVLTLDMPINVQLYFPIVGHAVSLSIE